MFLALNGSIDGGMITTRSCGTQSGTYSCREKMNASAGSMYGRRNAHPRSVSSLVVSRPTWQRQTTRAELAQAVDHAGGLRVVEQHDVAGADHCLAIGEVVVEQPDVVLALLSAERAAVPGEPCSKLCSRLVMAKNSVSPSRTSQRVSTWAPRP